MSLEIGEKKKRASRTAVFILMLVAIAAIAFSGYMLWDLRGEYVEGDRSYDRLAKQLKHERTEDIPPDALEEAAERTRQVEIPEIGIDFDGLKAVNEDCIGWLYCPDTVIDYPVMRADDYNYYLTRLPDGSNNKNGALFLDYHCRTDFTDTVSIIYGHNMKSGRMFGSLPGYKEQDFYQEHPSMYLYTQQGNYRIDLLYGFVVAAEVWQENGFMLQENSEGLMNYAAANTTFKSNSMDVQGGRYIAMSTCSYEFTDARYVVIGILTPEYAE